MKTLIIATMLIFNSPVLDYDRLVISGPLPHPQK